MKIRLNLLPKKRMKEIRRKTVLRFIIWQEMVVIFIIALFMSAIYGVNDIVKLRLDETNKESMMQMTGSDYKKMKNYEQSFEDIGNKLFLLQKIQRNDADWLNIFMKINNIVPNGVAISSLKNENYDIVLRGVATTRADLIDLKNGFDKEECFFDVSIPLSDIVLKNDIDFQLEFKVNKDCLLTYED